MIVRYQADADLNQAIVTEFLRREPKIDFQTAFAAGLEGVKDPDVLAIASKRGQGRILVHENAIAVWVEINAFRKNRFT